MTVIITLAVAVAVLAATRAYLLWRYCFSDNNNTTKEGVNND